MLKRVSKLRKNRQLIKALVIRVWNDDRTSFAQLYSLTCDDIYNYCRYILKNDQRAKEAVIKTYSYALTNILGLMDPSLFEAWLRRIAFQSCFDMLLYSSDENMYMFSNPAELESIPFFERQILFMYDNRNLSEAEISRILGITPRKVSAHLKSARTHLIQLKGKGLNI